MSAHLRSIYKVVATPRRAMSTSFSASRVPADALRLSPFLGVDHFLMSMPTFPPHPHAGFCAVTYVFEDSPGVVLNRDSLGLKKIISQGSLHWTTAGRGIVHEEVPSVRGQALHGLQIFVQLSSDKKLIEPRADHLESKDVPVFTSPSGARARVVLGDSNGVSSPLGASNLPTPVTLLDVTLPPGAAITHALPATDNAVLYVVEGAVRVGGRTVLAAEQAADFEYDGTAIEFKNESASETAQVVLLAGPPLDTPVVWHGSFCGDSRQQVAGFVEAYQAGRMGRLAAWAYNE